MTIYIGCAGIPCFRRIDISHLVLLSNVCEDCSLICLLIEIVTLKLVKDYYKSKFGVRVMMIAFNWIHSICKLYVNRPMHIPLLFW